VSAGRLRGRVDRGVVTTLETALREVHRPGCLETAWNWRVEAAILAVSGTTAVVIGGFAGLTGLFAAAGAGLAAVMAMLCWPPARTWLVSLGWCVVTPHRVRKACVHAWVQNRSGRLPIIMSTAPAPYGQAVRLWLRAGLTARDLEAAREVLAATCWATDVRVVPSARYAHLVTLEVIRKPQPEPARLAPSPWPGSRHSPGASLSDGAERDTPRGPALSVPARRSAADDDWLRPLNRG
jgi:hypothetical protein